MTEWAIRPIWSNQSHEADIQTKSRLEGRGEARRQSIQSSRARLMLENDTLSFRSRMPSINGRPSEASDDICIPSTGINQSYLAVHTSREYLLTRVS